jgi:hypothetical protein
MTETEAVPPYAMLRNFYFPSCLLMWTKHREAWGRTSATSDPSYADRSELVTFNVYWFASLFVIAEGWRDLKLSDPEIDPIIDAHIDSLRLLRNAVFPFQPKDVKFRQWNTPDRWNWAEKLMAAFQRYFDAHP